MKVMLIVSGQCVNNAGYVGHNSNLNFDDSNHELWF